MHELKLEKLTDLVNNETVYKLIIPQAYIRDVRLDKFDRALLDDIDNATDSDTPVADILLGLETLVRRIEQSQTTTPPLKEERTNV